MGRRHVLVILDRQTLYEHAPGLGLIPLDIAGRRNPVHLKCNEPSIHLVEQPLPDPKNHIWSVHGVVDGQDQGCAVLGNTQMPVPVFFGPDGKKATTLRQRQNF